MSAIVESNITYTLQNLRRLGNSRVSNKVKIAFGNGALTYSTGGIALTSGNLGCANTIESMTVVDQGTSGYQFNFNLATGKLQMFAAGSHNHSLLLKEGAQADGATTRVNAAASNKLGANTGADVIIAGVTSTTAATGGVVTAAPSLAMTEVAATVAPAALFLVVEVIGW